MKVCPICQRTYDEAEKFCFHDGMMLVDIETDNSPNEIEPETVLSAPHSEILYQESLPSSQPPPAIQNTRFIIAASMFGIMLLISVLGGGYWLITREQQTGQLIENVNTTKQAQTVTSSNSAFNSPTASQRYNSVNTLTPSISPTSAATSSTQLEIIREEVSDALFRWKSDAETLDFSAYMDNYADTVDYYRIGKSDRSRVSKDKQRAFRLYKSINITLNNIRIMPDASGSQATVILDKAWNFKGDVKSTEGEVKQQLILKKINDHWYIAGEKDLEVYYSRSY